MPQNNERQVFMVTAAKRHGKSSVVRKLIEAIPGDNILVYKGGVNVYDKAFEGYHVVPIRQYKGGRAIISEDDVAYKPFLKLVNKHFRNGVLVIDDASMYEVNDVSNEIRPLLINCRRLGVDVFLVYHSLADTPIRMFNYTDVLVLGRTGGNFKYKLNKLPAGEEITAKSARINRIVASCICDAQKPCKCGKRYYREVIKLS